ncbi:MAG: hypothetical protein RDU25_00015 [Patescibacteria group bacterium]|nr:hypothetical protein [Patescibacteria group bacterium]
MNRLNSTPSMSVNQRKAFAVILLAAALTNSQVTAVQAADPVVLAEQPEITQTVPAGITISGVTDGSEPQTVSEVQPSVQDVLLDVCKSNGYGQECAKTLLGMLWNESSNRSTVIGDNGKARGYFQIHYRLHKISIACAEDLVCSANWTLDYMEDHGYPRYVNYAVQCHNSCNVNNGYAAKAFRNGNRFWEKPLAIKQAAPIELAMK